MSIIRSPRRIALVATAAMTILAACSGGDDGDANPRLVEAAPPVGAQVSTARTQLGEVLADPVGLTLYAFTDDVDGTSTCFDTCATAWPPVDGTLPVADGLEQLGFDAISRPDGSTQLRLAGRWPLYTFAGDADPGDVNGQASAGVWFAVAADGSLIGLDGPADDADAPDPTVDADQTGSTGGSRGTPTELGPVLTNGDGLTLYAFTNDSPNTSTCFEPCSITWPPVAAGTVLSPAPSDQRLGAIDRPDGVTQIVLDGRPLYTYAGDTVPGDVTGQGIGNVWFAVGEDGKVLVPPTVRIGSTDAGDVLIDPDGFTMYAFANDRPGVSTCYDPCSATWPPVAGTVAVSDAIDAEQLGQITRDDGQSQLTFEGQPLYLYIGDENPGDANGVLVGADGSWAPIPGSVVRVAADDGNGNGDDTVGVGEPYPDGEAVGGAGEDGADAPAGVTVAESSLGPILVDAAGLTLYGFTDDTATSSNCNDACAGAWPPLPADVAIDPAVASGAELGSIVRHDGSEQLVVGIWPAYGFAGDAGPGDVNGQGSGGVWFALRPDGSLAR